MKGVNTVSDGSLACFEQCVGNQVALLSYADILNHTSYFIYIVYIIELF